MSTHHTVTLIPGDGVGPEVAAVAQKIMEAAGAPIYWEVCVAGKQAFAAGVTTGVPEETMASIAKNGVVLKGPLETPIGYGERSANVALRKLFETYANVRPIRKIPGFETPFSRRSINLCVIRENLEDLYAGAEYYQTGTSAESLKIMSEYGCEKVCRFAFEMALSRGFTRVDCVTKANIMKFSEGMFKRVFEEVSQEYASITTGHLLIDNCAHQLVVRPEQFQVIVTSNFNGDILSDLASGLVGGLGVAPSANFGDDVSIFESVHGSAPDIAGKDRVNPTAFILSACMMLQHLDLFDEARLIEDALVYTISEGKCLTADLANNRVTNLAGTQAFSNEIIKNLGKKIEGYDHGDIGKLMIPKIQRVFREHVMQTVGVDVFVTWKRDLDTLVGLLEGLHGAFTLEKISSRGVQVWPRIVGAKTVCVDLLTCRFLAKSNVDAKHIDKEVAALLSTLTGKVDWMHVEKLQQHNGQKAYS